MRLFNVLDDQQIVGQVLCEFCAGKWLVRMGFFACKGGKKTKLTMQAA